MAVLSEEDRSTIWSEFMQSSPKKTGQNFGAVLKADLRAAVDALDAFLEANASQINAAIPQPARGELTKEQKALLLQFVIERRYLRA